MKEPPSVTTNPYSAPLSGGAIRPDFETTFEETAVIDPQVMRAAARAHAGGSYLFRRVVLLIGGPLLLLLGGFMVYRSGGPAGMRSPFLTGLFLTVGAYAVVKGLAFNWFVERRARKSLIQSGGASQEIRFVIEPEWLGVNTDDLESRIRLSTFFKWKDDDELVLLYRTAKFYQVVPCDQFSHEATAALRNRLKKILG